MRELTPHDLDIAEDKLYKAGSYLYLVEHHEDGVFDVYTVQSRDRQYRVIRMAWFILCDCADFHFKGPNCKHLPVCVPVVCRKCMARPVKQRGATCDRCAAENAPYLKLTSNYKPERVGNIRI
jgi:hypothetical protein